MTLSQLRTFALVARLGSLHAAATALEVSEPAVSAALAALRLDLGDPLFVRSPGGITLTPGGRALADYAQDIVGLADQARWEVANAKNDAGQLKIAATAPFAEHAAGRLLDLFTKRVPGASVDVVAVAAEDVAALLLERAYDIALGARPLAPAGTPAADQGLESVPFLRYQRVFVADAADPLGRIRGPEIIRLSSETDALAAVRAGEGIMLAIGHIVRAEVLSGALIRVPVAGTPVPGLWWASTLDQHRTTTMAKTLQRFVRTADATAAMVARGGSRGLERRGSKFHVALWS